jgi:hypothetical protein
VASLASLVMASSGAFGSRTGGALIAGSGDDGGCGGGGGGLYLLLEVWVGCSQRGGGVCFFRFLVAVVFFRLLNFAASQKRRDFARVQGESAAANRSPRCET